MTNILVVEDNEKHLKLLKIMLDSEGYNVLAARDGEEGVRIAKERNPDLILMDIRMPVMDGESALRTLRLDEGTKNIPVIAVTAYAMQGDRKKYLEAGFADYVAKPIARGEFLEAIKKALGRQHG
jgi:two-component system cell cycle response regulator/two-component system cell cycle response regulator DivK